MDAYLIVFVALIALLVLAVRKASLDNRRRKRAWAAYYKGLSRVSGRHPR